MARRHEKSKPTPLIVQHFDSIAAIASDLTAPFTGPAASANESMSRRHNFDSRRGAHWYGVDVTSEELRQMATVTGYPEGGDIMRGFHEQVAARLPRALGFMRTKRKGDQGDELDYHAMLRGASDRAWTKAARTIKSGSGVLRLCVDIAGNCTQSADALRWRGIAGASLAEVMRRAGYSVEIQAVMATATPDFEQTINTYTSIVVKSRKATVDFDQLAATIGLPGFYRTFGFHSIIRSCDIADKKAEPGIGSYLSAESVAPLDPKVITLFVSPEVMDELSAVDWVARSVKLLQGAKA